VGVADHQGHAGESPGDQPAQERGPPGAVLGGDHVEAQHLAVPTGVDADRDNAGHVHDPALLADPLGERVEEHVGVGPGVQRPVPERVHLLVQAGGESGHLGAGDALDAHGLDHVVHPAGRDALDVALGDNRREGPLGSPAGLDEPVGEVAAGSQLGDGQADRAGPGVEVPVPVAVAHVDPFRADPAVAGAAQGVRLGRHQRVRERLDHPSQQVAAAVGLEVLADRISSGPSMPPCST
jgi:hypothetical protein